CAPGRQTAAYGVIGSPDNYGAAGSCWLPHARRVTFSGLCGPRRRLVCVIPVTKKLFSMHRYNLFVSLLHFPEKSKLHCISPAVRPKSIFTSKKIRILRSNHNACVT